MTDPQGPNGATAIAARLIADDVARNATTGRDGKVDGERVGKVVEETTSSGGLFGLPAWVSIVAIGTAIAVGAVLGTVVGLDHTSPAPTSAVTAGSGPHNAPPPSSPAATATTSTTSTTPVAPFGLGLSNSKVELSFKDRVFTSCPAADRPGVAPTFSGGWELATYPGAGAAGQHVGVTLTPGANSPFGNVENGTISSNGVLTVTGNSVYDYMALTLMLPAKVSTGHFTGLVDVSGTAMVHSHAAQGHPDCDQNWTVTGTVSPP